MQHASPGTPAAVLEGVRALLHAHAASRGFARHEHVGAGGGFNLHGRDVFSCTLEPCASLFPQAN